MKKLLALLAVVLCVVSCQTEPEGLDVNVGGEIDAIVNVTIPEAETRAAGSNSALGAIQNGVLGTAEDNTTMRYILQVYYNNEPSQERLVKYSDGTSVAFEVRLVPGRNYQFVVWADVVTDGKHDTDNHYVTSNLKNITLKGDWNAMDESRDAFTATKLIEDYNGAMSIDMSLKRPFAKLRVVTTDINNLTNLRIVPDNAVVEYTTKHRVAFNAFTGKAADASDYKTHSYTINPYSNETNTGAEYTLFTDYFFAENDVVKFNFNVYEDEAKTKLIKSNAFNTDINVQRNYLTTIKGNILTDGNNFEVKIEDAFAQPNIDVEWKEASTAQELVNIIEEINNSTTDDEIHISLNGNIDLNDLLGAGTFSTRAATSASVTIAKGKEVVLDIKDYTITGTDNETASYGMFNIQSGAKLTIEGNDGSIKLTAKNNRAWNAYSSVISNQCGEFVLNGGTIEHLGGTDMAYGIDNLTNTGAQNAKTTINGGVVKSTYRAIRQFLNSTLALNELIVNGGTINGANNKSIWMQNANVKVNPGKLVVAEKANLYGDVMVSGNNAPELAIELSLANAALKDGATVVPSKLPAGYSVVEENGVWVVKFTPVAKIGEKGYGTLAKAVAAVQDGETITLVADEVFTENNYYDNGGWKDGLGYNGDKSFTIDLNSKTIRQNGALNDYLIWIKNDGSKANTITLKNGTLDAGTTAYCAFATASSNKQKMTINFENINLVGNNSSGAVAKIRGGSELNVKAGTVITGNNNYVGIEAVGNNTVVNIYDGAEIYQNGTGSYVGGIVGASYNATMNIYGGYGKSAKCGIIVMSTGATINVSGGEWIANNDGTVANDNNAVLVSQNNRYESGWACKSILNVTGGTFKGGYNCYGMGPGVEPDDAQINIKGGNFNADPKSYVVAGYESVEKNGAWTVAKPQALVEFEAAIAQGGNVTLAADITLLESVVIEGKKVVLDLNGKTVNAPLFSAFEVKNGAELTIKNGKVVAYESTVRAIGGKATIESGEYTSTGTALDSPATYRYSLDCREGGELIINGGTFKSNNGMINVGSTVTINGGKFENIVEKSMTRHFAYVSAPLTINDGEFYGKANSSAGGCFFCGAGAGGDIQVKGGKFTSLWTSGSVNRIFEVYFGGTINVTGGMFNTNGGIATFVTENTDEATKVAYPYVAK